MTPFRNTRRITSGDSTRCRNSKLRRGVVTLELILTFPIIFILLLAVIEFGLIYSATQHVAYASRFGAKLAAEEPLTGLPDVNLASGGSRLRLAIDEYLQTVGLDTGSCRVILEHNVTGVSNPEQIDGPAGVECEDCVPPTTPETPDVILAGLPGSEQFPTTSGYVRVTVCVPIQGNVPDLLCSFGFSIEDCEFKTTTTFIYEACPDVP